MFLLLIAHCVCSHLPLKEPCLFWQDHIFAPLENYLKITWVQKTYFSFYPSKIHVSHLSTNIVLMKSNCFANCLCFLTVFLLETGAYISWFLISWLSLKERKEIYTRVIKKEAELSKSCFNVMILIVISTICGIIRYRAVVLFSTRHNSGK